jgi:hypothetical protein
MGTSNGQKLAGAAGIFFIVLTLASGFIVSPPPTPNESATKFLEYYSDHRNALLLQGIVSLLANIPAFIFVGGLWNLLRREEGESGVLAPGAVFAFVTTGAVTSVIAGLYMGLAFSADGNGLDESSARTLGLLVILVNPAIFSIMSPAAALSGYVLWRGSKMPNWVGWLGLLTGLVLLVATFSVANAGTFQPYGIFSFLGFLLLSAYGISLGVLMWMRADK